MSRGRAAAAYTDELKHMQTLSITKNGVLLPAGPWSCMIGFVMKGSRRPLLASFLRSNPQIGSRNRRALGDLLFNTLRWDLACDTLADRGVLDEPCRDAFRLAGGLILAMGQQAPALSELTQYLELSSQEPKRTGDADSSPYDKDPIWTTGLSPFLIEELTDSLDGEGFQQLAATLLRTGPIWLKTRAANETKEIA